MIVKFKLFWLFLFIGSALIALFFTYQSISNIWIYHTHSESAPANVLEWQVREFKNKYAIAAKYVFSLEGQELTGETLFEDKIYPNQYAAIDAIKYDLSPSKQIAWYNPNHPADSALNHKFPSMLLFRTILVLIVLLYFCFLKRFVINKSYV